MIRDLTIRILSAALLLLCVTAPGWLIQGTIPVDNAHFTVAYGVAPPPGYTATVPIAFDLVLSEIHGSAIYPTTGSPLTCSVSTNGSGIVNVSDCNSMYMITQQTGGDCIKPGDGGLCSGIIDQGSGIMELDGYAGAFEPGDMLCFNLGCDRNEATSWVTADLGPCGLGECFQTTGFAGHGTDTVYATAPIITVTKMYDLLGSTNCDGGTDCTLIGSYSFGNRGWQLLFNGFGPGGTQPCLYSSEWTGNGLSANNFSPTVGVTISTVGGVLSAKGANPLTFMDLGNNNISASSPTAYKINGAASTAANADALNAAIGSVTTTSADARLNVNGHVQGTGATITTGGSRPRLNGSGVQPDNPPSWVCEAAFGSGGASTVTQKKNWCLAETARWGITPLSGCSDE